MQYHVARPPTWGAPGAMGPPSHPLVFIAPISPGLWSSPRRKGGRPACDRRGRGPAGGPRRPVQSVAVGSPCPSHAPPRACRTQESVSPCIQPPGRSSLAVSPLSSRPQPGGRMNRVGVWSPVFVGDTSPHLLALSPAPGGLSSRLPRLSSPGACPAGLHTAQDAGPTSEGGALWSRSRSRSRVLLPPPVSGRGAHQAQSEGSGLFLPLPCLSRERRGQGLGHPPTPTEGGSRRLEAPADAARAAGAGTQSRSCPPHARAGPLTSLTHGPPD